MECCVFHGVVRHLHWHCYFTYKAQLQKTLQTPTKLRRISTNKKIYVLYIYVYIYSWFRFFSPLWASTTGPSRWRRQALDHHIRSFDTSQTLFLISRCPTSPRKKLVVTKTVIAVASTCSVHLPRLFPGLNALPKLWSSKNLLMQSGKGVVLAFVKFDLAVLAGTTLSSSLDKVSFCTAPTSSLLARSLAAWPPTSGMFDMAIWKEGTRFHLGVGEP